MGGPADTKVSVVEINKNDCHIIHSKIPNIQSFHSIAFTDEAMTFWQYYNTGIGKTFPFSGIEFESGGNVLEEFQASKKIALGQKAKERQKGIKDHSVP